jgi:hypothetical protein
MSRAGTKNPVQKQRGEGTNGDAARTLTYLTREGFVNFGAAGLLTSGVVVGAHSFPELPVVSVRAYRR